MNETKDTQLMTEEVAQFALKSSDRYRRQLEHLAALGWTERTTEPGLWTALETSVGHLDTGESNAFHMDGKPIPQRLEHTIHFPLKLAADLFLAFLKDADFGLQHVSCRQVVESLTHQEVTLVGNTLMTPKALTPLIATLVAKAYALRGAYMGWCLVDDGQVRPGEVANPGDFDATRGKRLMMMRLEYLRDVFVARALLAPWVCRWAECDDLDDYQSQKPGGLGEARVVTAACSGFGHTVKFEVIEGAPTLDELRWLLSQATDLHVAAESLNYADQYDGGRLHFAVLDELPSLAPNVETAIKRLTAAHELSQDAVVELDLVLRVVRSLRPFAAGPDSDN